MDYDLASVDTILQTTRSVRRRLDLTRPVDPAVIMQCLDIALQAPTGSNAQSWKWLLLTDPAKKAQIGAYYKRSWDAYSSGFTPDDSQSQPQRVYSSALYLAEHMGEVPLLAFACVQGRASDPARAAALYGSIIPAAWSFMLALRARGIGAAWTTLHLSYEKECNEILGIPDDVTTAVMLPVAYFTGETFQPAKRKPAAEVTYWEEWGAQS